MTTIVGFTGRKGSGKDTASQVLEAVGAVNLKFAGALKLMIATLLVYQGVDRNTAHRMVEGDLKEVPTKYLGGRTPRYAMQTLGTEWGRDLLSKTLWVDILERAALQYESVVVSDVRFPNEVAKIKAMGGPVFRIERGVPANDEHPSEALIDLLEVDGVLVNAAATPTDFQKQVYLMFQHLESNDN